MHMLLLGITLLFCILHDIVALLNVSSVNHYHVPVCISIQQL